MANPGELTTCKKGHHYYADQYSECPNCKKEQTGKTVSHTTGGESQVKMKYNERNAKQYDFDDDDVTVSCVKKKLGFAPIVGWLVCIDGECKGKDYPIRGERNYVGRDRSMDICIMDETVSRNNHASVNFDDRVGKYYYSLGMGRTIDHINDNPVFGTVELKKNDIIEIGSTKMLFVPLCGDKFKWEDWNEEK